MPLTEVDPGSWDDLLDRLRLTDTYYSGGYLEASAQLANGEPVFLHLKSERGHLVFPCIVRSDPADVVTPYGYGGPVALGADPHAFGEAYAAWCRSRGIVSTFAVFQPLLGNEAVAREAGFHVSRLGPTIAWRLGGRDLFEGMHKHHRRLARRAAQEGYEATVSVQPGDLSEFVGLYEQTMRRAGASSFYLFASSYWKALAARVSLVRVDVRHEGSLGASVLGFGRAPWLHYHLGANSDEGRRAGASQLALLTLARWGQENGFASLHLGGGVGAAEDSLFTFKQRFDPDGAVDCFIGKAVHDPDAYRRLSGTAAVDWKNFFPAYRAAR